MRQLLWQLGRHVVVGPDPISNDDGVALVNMGKALPKDKSKSVKDRSVGLTTSDAPA